MWCIMETTGTRTAAMAAAEGMDMGRRTRIAPLEITVERAVLGVMAVLRTTTSHCRQTTMSQIFCANAAIKDRPMEGLHAGAPKDQMPYTMDGDGVDHGTARA